MQIYSMKYIRFNIFEDIILHPIKKALYYTELFIFVERPIYRIFSSYHDKSKSTNLSAFNSFLCLFTSCKHEFEP